MESVLTLWKLAKEWMPFFIKEVLFLRLRDMTTYYKSVSIDFSLVLNGLKSMLNELKSISIHSNFSSSQFKSKKHILYLNKVGWVQKAVMVTILQYFGKILDYSAVIWTSQITLKFWIQGFSRVRNSMNSHRRNVKIFKFFYMINSL
jgi:hypothetical protein